MSGHIGSSHTGSTDFFMVTKQALQTLSGSQNIRRNCINLTTITADNTEYELVRQHDTSHNLVPQTSVKSEIFQ